MKIFRALKKIVLILLSIAILVGMLAYLSGAFHQKIEPEKVERDQRMLKDEPTELVHEIVSIEKVETVGTLRSVRRTEVSSRIMAAIVEMNARAGAQVKKGDILVRLDDRDLRSGLEEAKQGEVAAQAALTRATADFERYKSLFEEKVVSKQEYDESKAAYTIAQAQVQQAAQKKSAAETLLSHAVIESPVDGVVIDKLADVGDTASPGRTLLAIYDPSALRLEADAPEALASGLKIGQTLEMKIDTADSSEAIEGIIEEIVPQAEAASRSVLVKVRIPEIKPGMVEGAYGRLLIPTRERVRLCLPLSAVRKAGQLRFVDVVKENGILERRQVKLGDHSRLGRIEALSGVEGNERVALYGPPPEPLPEGIELFAEGETQ